MSAGEVPQGTARFYEGNLNLDEAQLAAATRAKNLAAAAAADTTAQRMAASKDGPLGLGGGGKTFKHETEEEEDDDDCDDEKQQSSRSSSDDASNNRTTDGQTMMHILKANIGTGVLAMPLAFRNVGLWLGLALVPLIGVICIHCMNILIQSHNRLCDRFNYESLDYDQVAALGLACGPRWARRLAKRASIIVTIFLMFTQIGFCCVYILFTVENLQVACMNLFQLDYSLITYLVAVFPIIGLTSCTSNLKHLARISTLANVLQLFGLALIFYDLLQFNRYAQGTSMAIRVEQGFSPDLATGLPLFFATAVYAFEGIGVVLPLVKEMADPRRITGLNGVLNTAMTNVALLYMAMGFFGYAKYGQTVAGSITLNLPEATHNELVRLAFALAIGLSYSLQFYVPWTIVWPLIDEALFYSYRPRKPRNKLQILSKLSAENQWAITEVLNSEAEQEGQTQEATDSDDKRNALLSNHSLATTLATSYSISMSTKAAAHYSSKRRTASNYLATSSSLHYGSMAPRPPHVGPAGEQVRGRRRNRMEDLSDEAHSDSDSMPEVQWRPPPRSMRGKRKLVRYTVILLTVLFTFVAAALIPRLDLFISLIGALASSCLAIIFPAIIQLCTYWNHASEQQEEDQDEQQLLEEDEESCLCTTTRQDEPATSAAHCGHCRSVGRRHKRRLRARLLWYLFALKNAFLLLFGVLGLITGTWVSMRQLGVATV